MTLRGLVWVWQVAVLYSLFSMAGVDAFWLSNWSGKIIVIVLFVGSIYVWTMILYPIQKLKKLVNMHHLYFGALNPDDLVPLDDVAGDLQALLQRTGHYDGLITGVFDDVTRKALFSLVGKENLEERWDGTGEKIGDAFSIGKGIK